MWQPNPSQWRVIWILAVIIVLFWPGAQERSLALKTVNWAADPRGTLPQIPGQFGFEGGDDPEVVALHDEQETAYERVYSSSRLARLRLRLRDAQDPFEPGTQQQILGAMAVLGAVLVWRLGGRAAAKG